MWQSMTGSVCSQCRRPAAFKKALALVVVPVGGLDALGETGAFNLSRLALALLSNPIRATRPSYAEPLRVGLSEQKANYGSVSVKPILTGLTPAPHFKLSMVRSLSFIPA